MHFSFSCRVALDQVIIRDSTDDDCLDMLDAVLDSALMFCDNLVDETMATHSSVSPSHEAPRAFEPKQALPLASIIPNLSSD